MFCVVSTTTWRNRVITAVEYGLKSGMDKGDGRELTAPAAARHRVGTIERSLASRHQAPQTCDGSRE